MMSGRSKEPLRCLVFTATSHDQVRYWDGVRGPVLKWGMSCHRLQNNIHSSDKKRVHRNVWVRNTYVSAISGWMGTFRSGNVLNVYAKAYYPSWRNQFYAVKVVAYTA
ncbi:hypothetical protein FB451DRAFT_1163975 [Mycena latifolia]|nr:hypothetical protein FB451DRAFT_1163975 [Mycena latifolia]